MRLCCSDLFVLDFFIFILPPSLETAAPPWLEMNSTFRPNQMESEEKNENDAKPQVVQRFKKKEGEGGRGVSSGKK